LTINPDDKAPGEFCRPGLIMEVIEAEVAEDAASLSNSGIFQ